MDTLSKKLVLGVIKQGGPGSGFFGHAGRPGQVGGSSSEGGSASEKEPKASKVPDVSSISKKTAKELGHIKHVASDMTDKQIVRDLSYLGEQEGGMSADENTSDVDAIGSKHVKILEPLQDRYVDIIEDIERRTDKLLWHEDEQVQGKTEKLVGKIEDRLPEELKNADDLMSNMIGSGRKIKDVYKEYGKALKLARKYEKKLYGVEKFANKVNMRESVDGKLVQSLIKQGGPGSGFFGHAGRPGERGGSASAGEGGSAEEKMRSPGSAAAEPKSDKGAKIDKKIAKTEAKIEKYTKRLEKAKEDGDKKKIAKYEKKLEKRQNRLEMLKGKKAELGKEAKKPAKEDKPKDDKPKKEKKEKFVKPEELQTHTGDDKPSEDSDKLPVDSSDKPPSGTGSDKPDFSSGSEPKLENLPKDSNYGKVDWYQPPEHPLMKAAGAEPPGKEAHIGKTAVRIESTGNRAWFVIGKHMVSGAYAKGLDKVEEKVNKMAPYIAPVKTMKQLLKVIDVFDKPKSK